MKTEKVVQELEGGAWRNPFVVVAALVAQIGFRVIDAWDFFILMFVRFRTPKVWQCRTCGTYIDNDGNHSLHPTPGVAANEIGHMRRCNWCASRSKAIIKEARQHHNCKCCH